MPARFSFGLGTAWDELLHAACQWFTIVSNERAELSLTTVVAAVIERDGLVLIGQRKPTRQHPLRWEFPGGKVEPGESPEAALTRELAEELGIQARAGPEIMRYQYQYPGRTPILLIFYRVTEFVREPQNLDFAQIAWASRASLRDYDFLEGDDGFIAKYSAD